jgi:hypothetical protein
MTATWFLIATAATISAAGIANSIRHHRTRNRR